MGFPPICAPQGHEGERLITGPRPCAGPANMRRGSAQSLPGPMGFRTPMGRAGRRACAPWTEKGRRLSRSPGRCAPVATAHGAPGYRTGAGGSFCRLRRAIRRPCLGGRFIAAGYRVPLPLGYAGGGHGGSCVFNRIMYVGGLFTDSAWAIAARVAIYDAPPSLPLSLTWDPAVAGFRSLGVAWLRL